MIDAWTAGTVVAGAYELREPLGERSWIAVHQRDRRKAVVRGALDEQPLAERWRALERASMLAGSVVPAVIERGRDGAVWWMAREFIEGQTLEEWLRARSTPTVSTPSASLGWFADALRPIAAALAQLHRAGLVHGSLWPEHIVRTPNSARFLSVERGSLGDQTEVGRLDGNPRFLSPGAWRGSDKTFADDLWALALVAFEMLTERSYWKANSVFEFAREAMTSTIGAPSARAKGVGVSRLIPKGFDDWFLACVTREDSRAYADGDEALDALEVLVLRAVSGPAIPGPCLDIAPQVCLNIAPMPCLSPVAFPPPIPCLSPVRPQPCLKVAPKLPGIITRLRDAWDEQQRENERAREEKERARQQNEIADNPYRGVVLRPGEGKRKGARRAAFVGVAVSAAVIAWWLAKRC